MNLLVCAHTHIDNKYIYILIHNINIYLYIYIYVIIYNISPGLHHLGTFQIMCRKSGSLGLGLLPPRPDMLTAACSLSPWHIRYGTMQ